MSPKSDVPDPSAFCAAIDDWAARRIDAERESAEEKTEGSFARSWREVRLQITKSCLLDRVLYHGERPSQTPCPVHRGIWSGCHLGWPGQKWSDGRAVEESLQLRSWFDAGCRCFLHGCGCTTGWQPDDHCGCGETVARAGVRS